MDSKIHEDQIRNFLVNVLTGAFTLDLGENAEIDPEDIFEILIGATADGTSISSLCDLLTRRIGDQCVTCFNCHCGTVESRKLN